MRIGFRFASCRDTRTDGGVATAKRSSFSEAPSTDHALAALCAAAKVGAGRDQQARYPRICRANTLRLQSYRAPSTNECRGPPQH